MTHTKTKRPLLILALSLNKFTSRSGEGAPDNPNELLFPARNLSDNLRLPAHGVYEKQAQDKVRGGNMATIQQK